MEDSLERLMRAIEQEYASHPQADGSEDVLSAHLERFMNELKSGVKVSKEDQDVLNAIFNAVELGDFASSGEAFREA